jgi:hypothetical protein
MNNSKDFLINMIQNEISSMGGPIGAVGDGDIQGYSLPLGDKPEKDEDTTEETQLRSIIREICKRALLKAKPVNEEVQFRSIVRRLILEAKKEVESAPHSSTAINLLEELLKQILPGVETDFKTLTTSQEQRDSFRANLLDAVSKLLAAEDVNAQAGDTDAPDIALDEIDLKIDDDAETDSGELDIEPDDMFIDIDDKGEIPAEEEVAFGIEGQEETGRNMAAKTYDNIEKNIVDSYAILSDDTDRKTFRDYLITNLKMYFDKYEAELSTEVKEPTTDEYEKEKDDQSLEMGAQEDFETGVGEDELDLEL